MTSMPKTFYRVAAAASILSAFTTLGLIFLPELFATNPEGIAGRMMRVTEPAYQLRAWIYLIHPFLCFTAILAMGIACRRVAPALALAGILGFGLWAITEAGQQTLTLFAFDDWRRAWLAGDPAVRATMELRAAIYDGLWDAAYSLLLIGIILGSAFFCAMLLKFRDGLSRTVGILFGANVFLSLTFLSGEVGGPTLPPGISFWIYPALQPLARVLIGLWLFRIASDGEPSEA
jgi:hypothetical protein